MEKWIAVPKVEENAFWEISDGATLTNVSGRNGQSIKNSGTEYSFVLRDGIGAGGDDNELTDGRLTFYYQFEDDEGYIEIGDDKGYIKITKTEATFSGDGTIFPVNYDTTSGLMDITIRGINANNLGGSRKCTFNGLRFSGTYDAEPLLFDTELGIYYRAGLVFKKFTLKDVAIQDIVLYKGTEAVTNIIADRYFDIPDSSVRPLASEDIPDEISTDLASADDAVEYDEDLPSDHDEAVVEYVNTINIKPATNDQVLMMVAVELEAGYVNSSGLAVGSPFRHYYTEVEFRNLVRYNAGTEFDTAPNSNNIFDIIEFPKIGYTAERLNPFSLDLALRNGIFEGPSLLEEGEEYYTSYAAAFSSHLTQVDDSGEFRTIIRYVRQ